MLAKIIFKRLFGGITLFIGVSILGWCVYNLFHPTPEFRREFRSIFQLLIPILFIFYGYRWLRDEGPGIESTPADFNSPELLESVSHAHQTLPYFLQQVQANIDNAFVKFPLKTPRAAIEHIWAYVHSYRDGKLNVSLANGPHDVNLSQDGRRDVPIEEVEDWKIMLPDGKIKGAYSLIALFRHRESQGKKLSPKMRKQRTQLLDAGRA